MKKPRKSKSSALHAILIDSSEKELREALGNEAFDSLAARGRAAAEKALAETARVKCKRCGMEYDAGQPHAAFCRGAVPPGSKCECCGNDQKDSLLECQCGAIVCDCCHENEDDSGHDCPEGGGASWDD